jgi:hypothetical protein
VVEEIHRSCSAGTSGSASTVSTATTATSTTADLQRFHYQKMAVVGEVHRTRAASTTAARTGATLTASASRTTASSANQHRVVYCHCSWRTGNEALHCKDAGCTVASIVVVEYGATSSPTANTYVAKAAVFRQINCAVTDGTLTGAGIATPTTADTAETRSRETVSSAAVASTDTATAAASSRIAGWTADTAVIATIGPTTVVGDTCTTSTSDTAAASSSVISTAVAAAAHKQVGGALCPCWHSCTAQHHNKRYDNLITHLYPATPAPRCIRFRHHPGSFLHISTLLARAKQNETCLRKSRALSM